MISMFISSRSSSDRQSPKYGPSGVSTSTMRYSSDGLVATDRVAMESNRPSGWHFSRSSCVSRSWCTPVIIRTMLSIMYPYVMYSQNVAIGSTAWLRRKLNSSTSFSVHFSASVVVEMGEGSFWRKLP